MFTSVIWTSALIAALSIASSHQQSNGNDASSTRTQWNRKRLTDQELDQKINQLIDSKLSDVNKDIKQIYQGLNECNSYNGGCEHICTNTKGSYECSCHPGNQLAEDGHKCVGEPCNGSDGFIKLEGSSKCYKAFKDQLRTWQAANDLCESVGLALAEPEDPAQIRKTLNEEYGAYGYWVGGVGTGKSVQLQRGYGHVLPNSTLWYPGHPEAWGYNTNQCLAMHTGDSYLRDHPNTPYFTNDCSTAYLSVLCEVKFD